MTLSHPGSMQSLQSPKEMSRQAHIASPVCQKHVPCSPQEVREAMSRPQKIPPHQEPEMMAVDLVDGSAAVPTDLKLYWLTLYFLLNLALTLYNKALMFNVRLNHSVLIGFSSLHTSGASDQYSLATTLRVR
jgi:hypothetical protein